MSGEHTNLVAKTLRGNDGNFIADTFIGLEVEGELGVVTFDDDFGGLLDGLEEQIFSIQALAFSQA